ncbi:hypothetical protein DPMN_028124 [Dreissena polymorpha]|uniref:Uncharacterized protein n=1 Tax=Dreissena polymorpha TaxID=45954 RepID=A0A9D4LU49_DREPO|nr:hypothetical protein DPMN_028124 [Dreissena polymorpha]
MGKLNQLLAELQQKSNTSQVREDRRNLYRAAWPAFGLVQHKSITCQFRGDNGYLFEIA